MVVVRCQGGQKAGNLRSSNSHIHATATPPQSDYDSRILPCTVDRRTPQGRVFGKLYQAVSYRTT